MRSDLAIVPQASHSARTREAVLWVTGDKRAYVELSDLSFCRDHRAHVLAEPCLRARRRIQHNEVGPPSRRAEPRTPQFPGNRLVDSVIGHR
jgi:hypothetical protein